MTRTVIFDFDGTVAIGRGPVEAYLAEVVTRTGDTSLADSVADGLVSYEAGESEALDGYDVVRRAATDRGVPATVLDEAYRASRASLATPAAPIVAPAGLADHLSRLSVRARIVIATNAPSTRLAPALEALGIARLVDDVHASVGKPEGLVEVVEHALRVGPVLSIGDIAANDLVPAAALGAATALVGPTAARDGSVATMAARTLPELYSAIETWVGISPPASAITGTGPHHERHH